MIEEFKIELRALLERYGATLGCDIEGDMHGNIATMIVEINKKDYELCNGCWIDSYDLR